MKRLFVLVFLLITLVSCADNLNADPFAVFDGDFEAQIALSCQGNESRFLYDNAKKLICFTYPDELSGYQMQLTDKGVILSYDGISVPISEYAARLLMICGSVFSEQKESISDIAVQGSGKTASTVVKTQYYTYVFCVDGLPKAISGLYNGVSFEMSFSSFSVGE